MRVLLANTRARWLTEWGGDTTQIVETAKELSNLGVDVEVGDTTPLTARGFDVVHLFNIQTARGGTELAQMATDSGVPIALSTIYWDLTLAHTSPEELATSRHAVVRLAATVAPALAQRAKQVQARLSHDRLNAAAAARLLLAAAVILPNSAAELEMVIRKFDHPDLRGRTVIVPNGVDPELIEKTLSSSSDVSLLPPDGVVEMAAIYPVKGQHTLIKALLEHPEIPLTFVGRDGDSRYARYCRELGAARGNTYFTGPLNRAEALVVCSRAKVHALPSLRESPGLSSLEAAALGLNIVVGRECPIPEYFGTEAFMCDPGD